jgi:hypothetical protein
VIGLKPMSEYQPKAETFGPFALSVLLEVVMETQKNENDFESDG